MEQLQQLALEQTRIYLGQGTNGWNEDLLV